MEDCTHHTSCRICGGEDLALILDLGKTPPANAYVKKADLDMPEATYPLATYFCRTCTLLQLLDVVAPEILFKDYHYLTSASDPMVAHFEQYARDAIRPFITSKEDLVIDIGGNDGVLLSFLKNDTRVLNVDPADNLAEISRSQGVPFYAAFFSSRVAQDLIDQYGHAKVVSANNVFAHVDSLRDVFKGVAALLADNGVFIFEVHWVKHLVDENAFDQIYHEHLCYHSLHALKYLVEHSGMRIFDVQIVPTQGRSLRVFASKNRAPQPSVRAVLDTEAEAGLDDENTYRLFAERVKHNKKEVVEAMRSFAKADKKICGYGAPAKGNTLLNYYGLGPDVIAYLTDTTPLKQGLYSPGMHIPIVSPERLLFDTPDYIILLAWNFKDAILEKEAALRARGVKFISTIPQFEII